MSAVAALTGVLVAQAVVLWVYRQNERRRGDPELLRQCAQFSVAVGRLKREFTLNTPGERDLRCLDELDTAADSLEIIGPPEVQKAVDRLVGDIAIALIAMEKGDASAEQAAVKRVFAGHMQFTQVVRTHFRQPPRQHVAVPILRRPRIG